jgi:predicted amidohydrolase
MHKSATVICQQLAPRVGEPEANRNRTIRAIGDAVSDGADLVVLPELATSGFIFRSQQEAEEAAIAASDELFERWSAAAASGPAIVVGGFCERGDDGALYNSAAVVDGSGLLGVYRKLHLWDREKLFFVPGSDQPPIFDTAAGRVGVLICYDLEFPEMSRALALRGAEIIAVPTNWPRLEASDLREPEVTIATAMARVNRVHICCCDRTGTERGQEWIAGTSIIDARGRVLATQRGEGPARGELDLELARDKRLGDHADALADRRPELYGALADRIPQGAPGD